MTNTAQELFEHLRDAKPGNRHEPKPNCENAQLRNSGEGLFKPLTPSRVELPALGDAPSGSCTLVYDRTPFLPGPSYWHEEGT